MLINSVPAQDTKNAVRQFLAEGVDLILFCGGDGTARDVFDIAGRNVPVLGIPAGVKMYSAVFAIDPVTAAEIVAGYQTKSLRDSEVIDVDEEAYRAGKTENPALWYCQNPGHCRKSAAPQANI